MNSWQQTGLIGITQSLSKMLPVAYALFFVREGICLRLPNITEGNIMAFHEKITKLREEKMVTQSELAEAIGTTCQVLQDWESGTSSPEYVFLPKIADFFGVSIDVLFSRIVVRDTAAIVEDIKTLFNGTPENECLNLALKLALFLHEAVVSKGHKIHLPWYANKMLCQPQWGNSICSEKEGITIIKHGVVLFFSHDMQSDLTPEEIHVIWSEFKHYSNKDNITVLFGLYELTRHDFNLFVDSSEIATKVRLDEAVVLGTLKNIPTKQKQLASGSVGYRFEEMNMHIPALFSLVRRH